MLYCICIVMDDVCMDDLVGAHRAYGFLRLIRPHYYYYYYYCDLCCMMSLCALAGFAILSFHYKRLISSLTHELRSLAERESS